MHSFTSSNFPARLLGLLLAPSVALAAPSLVKLHNFNNSGVLQGLQGPMDTPVLLGSELWFTTEKGGDVGFGTLASFDLANNTATKRVSLDLAGNTPQGTPDHDGGLLYYTNTRGGTGDRGTLSVYSIAGGTNDVLWDSPSNSPSTNPNTVPGNVAVIDRGSLGKDIYMLTGNGGIAAAVGTIQRYQTHDGSVTQVHAFGNPPDSRQPFKGFTVVGTKLYFTTFTGGNISPSGSSGGTANNGTGTLNELDVTTRGAEIYRQLATLPIVDGSTRFPAHNPYYRAADHCLYFTTVGTATQPGSLQKFDLNTGTLSTLYEIDATPAGEVTYPEGRFIYGTVTEWNRALYYATAQGGATGNGGTINRFDLATCTHEVLFNLDSTTGDNPGGGVRGGFVYNGSTTFPCFYLLTRDGGVHDHGTILRLNLDPPVAPASYENWQTANPAITGTSAVPNADADGDGLSNKLEFAFGTDPAGGAHSAPTSIVPTGESLEIRWTARTDGTIAYQVTGSPALGAEPAPWTPVAATVEALPVPDIAVPCGYERRRAIIPLTDAANFFCVEATFLEGALP